MGSSATLIEHVYPMPGTMFSNTDGAALKAWVGSELDDAANVLLIHTGGNGGAYS